MTAAEQILDRRIKLAEYRNRIRTGLESKGYLYDESSGQWKPPEIPWDQAYDFITGGTGTIAGLPMPAEMTAVEAELQYQMKNGIEGALDYHSEQTAGALGRGYQGFVSNFYRMLGNLMQASRRVPEIFGAEPFAATGVEDFLYSAAEAQAPEQLTQKPEIGYRMLESATRLGLDLPVIMGISAVTGGTGAGLATYSGIGALDQDFPTFLSAVVQGYFLGHSLHAVSPLALPSRMAAGAGMFGGLAAAEGQPAEEVFGQSVLGSLMMIPGEGRLTVKEALNDFRRLSTADKQKITGMISEVGQAAGAMQRGEINPLEAVSYIRDRYRASQDIMRQPTMETEFQPPAKPAMGITPSQSDKFYISEMKDGKIQWTDVSQESEPIAIPGFEDFDLFLSVRPNNVVVSEGVSGAAIGRGVDRDHAIANAVETLKKHGADKLKEGVMGFMAEQHQRSPRYPEMEKPAEGEGDMHMIGSFAVGDLVQSATGAYYYVDSKKRDTGEITVVDRETGEKMTLNKHFPGFILVEPAKPKPAEKPPEKPAEKIPEPEMPPGMPGEVPPEIAGEVSRETPIHPIEAEANPLIEAEYDKVESLPKPDQLWKQTVTQIEQVWGRAMDQEQRLSDMVQPYIDRLNKELESLKGKKDKASNEQRKQIKEAISNLGSASAVVLAHYEGEFENMGTEMWRAANERAKRRGMPDKEASDLADEFLEEMQPTRPQIERNYNKTLDQIFNEVWNDHAEEKPTGKRTPADTDVRWWDKEKGDIVKPEDIKAGSPAPANMSDRDWINKFTKPVKDKAKYIAKLEAMLEKEKASLQREIEHYNQLAEDWRQKGPTPGEGEPGYKDTEKMYQDREGGLWLTYNHIVHGKGMIKAIEDRIAEVRGEEKEIEKFKWDKVEAHTATIPIEAIPPELAKMRGEEPGITEREVWAIPLIIDDYPGVSTFVAFDKLTKNYIGVIEEETGKSLYNGPLGSTRDETGKIVSQYLKRMNIIPGKLPVKGAPSPEAEPPPTPEVDPKAVAEQLGIEYRGEQPMPPGKPNAYLFNDPQSDNTTFAVKDLTLRNVQLKLAEVRNKFSTKELEPSPEDIKNALNTKDFQPGDIVRDIYTAKRYEIIVPDKRGMGKIRDLDTDKVGPMNAYNNPYFIKVGEKTETPKVPGAERPPLDIGETYAWRANADAGQEKGNYSWIRPITEELFRQYVKPALRDPDMTLERYQQLHPEVSHLSFVQVEGKGPWKFQGAGSIEELRPSGEESKWAMKVEDTAESQTAGIEWRQKSDTEAEAETKAAETATQELDKTARELVDYLSRNPESKTMTESYLRSLYGNKTFERALSNGWLDRTTGLKKDVYFPSVKGMEAIKAETPAAEAHFIFLDRDGKRVPVAGPYKSEADLKADLSRVDEMLHERDAFTHFDTRVFGKVTDPETIKALTRRIQKYNPMGQPRGKEPVDLADYFKRQIEEDWQPENAREMIKEAQVFDEKLTEKDIDKIYDAYEAALARQFADATGAFKNVEDRYKVAKEYEERIPRRPRSLEASSLEKQQFSTPLTLAMAMGDAARITDADIVLEPTAGTGSLVAPVRYKPDGWILNELDPGRNEIMKKTWGDTSQENYLESDFANRASVIIMNPPWGGAGRAKLAKAAEVPDLAALFVDKAMRDLVDGGRLVALLPTTMLPGQRMNAGKWWKQFGDQYTVKAVILSPEKAYGPGRGTDIGSWILVADKVKPDMLDRPDVIALYSREGKSKYGLDHAADVHHALERFLGESRNAKKSRNIDDLKSVIDLVGDRPGTAEIPPGGEKDVTGGKPGPVSAGLPRPARIPAPGPRRPTGESEPPTGERPTGQGPIRPEAPPRTEMVAPGEERGIPAPAPGGAAGERKAPRIVRTEGKVRSRVFAEFKPRIERRAGKPHPRRIVLTRASAALGIPDSKAVKVTDEVHSLNKSGFISDEQLDFIARGIDANVNAGHGFGHGYDVGVGKSRIVVGTAYDELASGRSNRILVMTASRINLIERGDGLLDMFRKAGDGEFPYRMVDVSLEYPDASAARKAKDQDIPRFDKAVYFIDANNYHRFHNKLKDIDFDCLICDESDSFRNIYGSQRGLDWIDLHLRLLERGAKFHYLSATIGRNIEEMEYLFGLGLWKPGEFEAYLGKLKGQKQDDIKERQRLGQIQKNTLGSLSDIEKERERLAKGKPPSKSSLATHFSPSETEQIVREMTARGYMMSADLWREGIEFETKQNTLTPEEKAHINRLSEFYNKLRTVYRKYAKIDKRKLRARFGIEGPVQALMKYHYYRLRLQRAIDEAEAAIKAGEQPIISVLNIRGDSKITDAEVEGYEMDRKTGLPRHLTNAIEQVNTVAWEVDKWTGQENRLGVVPEAEVAKAELYDDARELWGEGWSDPIKEITDRFGVDQVANLTGRVSSKVRMQHMADFNKGKRPVAVASKAGKRGVSIQDTNGRRRYWIDTDPEYSPDSFKQALGRVDRADQKSAPKISIMHFGLPGERRFLGDLSSRMKNLGATSKGKAESTGTESMASFEFSSSVHRSTLRAFWRRLPRDDKDWWTHLKSFRDNQGEGRMELEEIDANDLKRFWRSFQTIPYEDADRLSKLYEQVYTEQYRDAVDAELKSMQNEGIDIAPYKEAIAQGADWTELRKQRHETGEVLRDAILNDDLHLYEVKAVDQSQYGVLTGIISENMPKLRDFLPVNKRSGEVRFRFVEFDTGTETIPGLEIQKTKVKPLASMFKVGGFGTAITPDNAIAELRAGEKIYLGNGWTIHHGRSGSREGKYVVTGPKMKDVVHEVAGQKRLKYGLNWQPVGSFFYAAGDKGVQDLIKTFSLGTAPEATEASKMRQQTDAVIKSQLAGKFKIEPPPEFDQEKGISTYEITKWVRKTFDVPVRHKKFAGRTRGGIFKRPSQVIRLRDADDLGTLMHELAHKIDHDLKIRERYKDNAELMQLDYDYPEKQRIGEGFAEYFREWMTGGDEHAKEIAPIFFNSFDVDFLKNSPELMKNLRTLQSMNKRMLEQGAYEHALQTFDWKGKMADLPFAQKIGSFVRWNIRLWTDEIYGLEYAEKKIRGLKWRSKLDPVSIPPSSSPTMMARADAKKATGKAIEMLMNGTYNYAKIKTGASLRDALEPINNKADLEKLTVFMFAERSLQSYLKRGMKTNLMPAEVNFLISNIENQRISGDYKLYGKNPTFRRIAEEVTGFQDRVLDYLGEAAGLDPDARIAIRQANPIYIPLKVVFEEAGRMGRLPTGGKAFLDLPNALPRVKGSSRARRNPWWVMIEQTAQMINLADKMRVMRRFVDLAKTTKGGGKFADKVTPPMRHINFSLEQIESQLAEMGFEMSENSKDQFLSVWINAGRYFGKEPIGAIVRNGKPEFWQFDPEVWAAIKGMDQFHLGPAMDFLFGKPTRAFRLVTTGLRPGFAWISNPLRDAFTYSVQSEARNIIGNVPGAATVEGLLTKIQGGEVMDKFRRSAVDFSTYIGMDRQGFAGALDRVMGTEPLAKALNVVKHPIEVAKELVGVMEAAPRLTEFKRILKAAQKKYGEESADAAIWASNAAQEVTLNFSRMGTIGSVVNQIVPFWNAMVQSPIKLARVWITHPARTTFRGMAYLTIPTYLLWRQNRDEEWYKEMPPWLKYGFWNFKIGDKIIRLPRPFTIGTVFSSIPEAIMNYWYHDDPVELEDAMGEVADQVGLSWDQWMPLTIKGVTEVVYNYDAFRDRPVVPEYMQLKPETEQYYEWTPRTFVELGKVLQFSPLKIQQFDEAYLAGSVGDISNMMEDILAGKEVSRMKQPADYPLVGRLFHRQRTKEQRHENIMYERRLLKARIKNAYRAKDNARAMDLIRHWNIKYPKYAFSRGEFTGD